MGGRGRRDGSTEEPLADGETREPKPTREPCEGEDCQRRGKGRGRRDDDSREPCDDKDATETPAEATEAPEEDNVELRRLLRGRGKGKGRGRRDRPTREPLAEGETREPKATREPCEGDDCSQR